MVKACKKENSGKAEGRDGTGKEHDARLLYEVTFRAEGLQKVKVVETARVSRRVTNTLERVLRRPLKRSINRSGGCCTMIGKTIKLSLIYAEYCR